MPHLQLVVLHTLHPEAAGSLGMLTTTANAELGRWDSRVVEGWYEGRLL
jgi:hypothetical protein